MPPNPSKEGRETVSDEELVARTCAGDASAFAALFERYQDRVYQMALRILGHREDALDAAQEIFLAVHRSLASFEGRSRFSTWLYRITVNRCRDVLRSFRRRAPETYKDEPLARGPGPLDRASAVELHGRLEALLRELPDELREILVLRDVQDLAYEEIASALEIPVGTVRSRLHRARSLLAERMRPLLAEERE